MDRKQYLKEWREKNKGKVKIYHSNYFAENKDAIYNQRHKHEAKTGYNHIYNNATKVCDCGKELLVKSLYKHRKICLIYKNTLINSSLLEK